MLSASQDVRRLGHAPTASCRTATCRWCSNLRHSRQFKGRVVYSVFYRNMADSEDQALLQQQYQAMRMDANGLASKISELEQGLAAFSLRIARILSTLIFRRSSRA